MLPGIHTVYFFSVLQNMSKYTSSAMGVWGCLQLPPRTDTTTQIILMMCLEPWKINIHTHRHTPLWIRSGDWHAYRGETRSGCRSPMMLQIRTLWDLEHLDDNLSQTQPRSYCWVLTHVHVNFSKHCRLFSRTCKQVLHIHLLATYPHQHVLLSIFLLSLEGVKVL